MPGVSPYCTPIWDMAVGQTYHFGVAPPILVFFGEDWDFHWGYGILTHGHIGRAKWTSLDHDLEDCFLKGWDAALWVPGWEVVVRFFLRGEEKESPFGSGCLMVSCPPWFPTLTHTFTQVVIHGKHCKAEFQASSVTRNGAHSMAMPL